MKRPGSRITIGNLVEVMKPDVLREVFTEYICVLVFVFLAEGCVIFFTKLIPIGGPTSITFFLTVALTHGLGLMVAVAFGVNVSGGHANPAVTFGAFLGGHITFVKSVLYSIAQCLGSISAMFLLKLATNGVTVYGWTGLTPVQAIIYEIIMVSFIVYAYSVTIFDPKSKKRIIAPFVIGLLCTANVLCGGSYFGAAMNPAMSLCVAVISGSWNNHWMYWLGPYVGAAIATVVYQSINTSVEDIYEQLPITKPVKDDDTYKQPLITKT